MDDKENMMKSMKAICALLLGAGTMLGGCAVYTPHGAVVTPGAVVVDPGPGPYHCPPGQAKKGRC
ncbi:vir-repressed protein [Cupriavidus sp. HPC(L)]|nr:hypothetical protein [Cupriavidus gilardii]ESH87570.1 vir-repressed protein [Cupriavidus sp. HPC(L)]MCT9071074.1 hypothetical protein [Cupriavidus gilardii]QKS60449.1 hypothetical protein FOB47_03370 [Cupriavidus gilardii]